MSDADFRLIPRIPITDSVLTSSSVPEVKVAEYSSGTAYAAGDIRGVSTGTKQAVYESLQGGNLGNTPSSSPAWWKPLGAVYATYSSGVTYALDEIVTDPAAHLLYSSLIGGNLGNSLADETKWKSIGATNRWKAFDRVVNSQTVAPESVTFTLTPPGVVNTMMLLNLAGSSVSIAQADSGYSRTKSLVRHEVTNWYDFFYQEPIRAGDAVFGDIPPYPGSSITVTVTNPGADASVGLALMGKSLFIGTTQWELTAGVLSYSTASTDQDTGSITMKKRPNARRMNFEVSIPKGYETEAYRLLSTYTDVEIGVIATRQYELTYSYGFLGQWDVPLSIRGRMAPIEFRGLT
jgi:hypothetical protein